MDIIANKYYVFRFAILLIASSIIAKGLSAEANPAYTDSSLKRIFKALDEDNTEIKAVLLQYNNGSASDAVDSLLSYYSNKQIDYSLIPETLKADDAVMEIADNAVAGIFTFQGVTSSPERDATGHYNWYHKGPNNDPEWAWFFNRHTCFRELYAAWKKTGDKKYINTINAILIDWVKSNPVETNFSLNSAWRALEAARRINGPWIEAFYGKDGDQVLNDEAKILMLSSIPDHAEYLMDHHSFDGNHLLTEMMALAEVAILWPEFKDAAVWLNYATEKIYTEIYEQTYPDGSFRELANHYQRVALISFENALKLLKSANRKEVSKIQERMELMWTYWAEVMRPFGRGPLNNDSDLEENRELLQTVLNQYNRPDWDWIAHQGKMGSEPEGSPSKYFPWAGHAIMRSDWSSDAQWAFFDMGPHGSDHQHNDRLHLSITVAGQDYLVDAGRYNYKPGKIRDYFKGPASHNLILLDGQGTIPPPDIVSSPLPVRHEIHANRDVFSAEAVFKADAENGRGSSRHRRTVVYDRGVEWNVTDKITTFGARMIEVLWHFHPDCDLAVEDSNSIVTTFDARRNIRLIPENGGDWEVELIRGQDEPTVQGWYSREFNHRSEATAVIFRRYISLPTEFSWKIKPLPWTD